MATSPSTPINPGLASLSRAPSLVPATPVFVTAAALASSRDSPCYSPVPRISTSLNAEPRLTPRSNRGEQQSGGVTPIRLPAAFMSSPSPIARSLATSRAVPTVYVEAKKRNFFDDDGDDEDQLVPDISGGKEEETKTEDEKQKKVAEKPSSVLTKRPKKTPTLLLRRDRDNLDEMVVKISKKSK